MTRPDHAAYGGAGWSARVGGLASEVGSVWGPYAVESEWETLTDVLLHAPGEELARISDPQAALMLERPDPDRARAQHEGLCSAFAAAGVRVHRVEPVEVPPPNQMFVADVMFMTPEGAVVGRPASPVRAGEERWVARRLADLGVPILRTVAGRGTFEGADAMWLRADTVMVGVGFRTNAVGARQLESALAEQGVHTVLVDLPRSVMHLMGALRIFDHDLAFARTRLLPADALHALTGCGYRVQRFPDEDEARVGMANNTVTLGPRRILMPAGNPVTEAAARDAGVDVTTVPVDELAKAAGAIGCLTGVLSRLDAGGDRARDHDEAVS